MKDYVLKDKPVTASGETVWAFDLGKGSIGEAVRRGNEFLHKASLPCRAVAQRRLVIPAEFAETKTAAGRRWMWRTRQAREGACAPNLILKFPSRSRAGTVKPICGEMNQLHYGDNSLPAPGTLFGTGSPARAKSPCNPCISTWKAGNKMPAANPMASPAWPV